MTLEMIGTQSIHPDYSNLHNIYIYIYIIYISAKRRLHISNGDLDQYGQIFIGSYQMIAFPALVL